MSERPKGPYIIWVNYGSHENWKPYDYETIEDALVHPAFGGEWILTKPVKLVESDNVTE